MGDTNIFSNINNLISGAIKKVAQNVTTSTTDATSTTDTTSTTDATSTTNTNGAQKTQGTTPKNPVDMAQDIKNKELKNDENDKVVCIIGYDEDNDKGISVGEFGKFIKDAYGEDQFEEEQINFLFNVLDSSEPEKADNQDEKADTSKGDIYTAQAEIVCNNE